jgi:hypothetical protein
MPTCCTWSSCDLGYWGGINPLNEQVLIKETNRNRIYGSHMPLHGPLVHHPGKWGVLEPNTGPFFG